jgi:hypothetical protein
MIFMRRNFRLLGSFQGFKHAYGCAMHISGQETDSDPMNLSKSLELVDEPVSFFLICGI